MLKQEENDYLTRTGPGTPMGNLLKRYWVPALLCEELPFPDCPPIRVKLFSESLVAFRDSDGKVGLMDEFCGHRRASLFFGKNSDCGLRCVYHGWKYDVDGNCVEMPNEPDGEFHVKIQSYPCEERGGIIWAYMGPPELKPGLPEYEFILMPESHVYVSKRLAENNYLQAVEGSIDSSHASWLHQGALEYAVSRVMKKRAANPLLHDLAPKFEVEKTDFGMMVAAKRKASEGQTYWRVTQFLMPYGNYVPPGSSPIRAGHFWVPADDESCWSWSFTWNPSAPLSKSEVSHLRDGFDVHAATIQGSFKTIANKENDYLINREFQASGKSLTGIKGIQTQDQAVQESMGPIMDRTKERLGKSDVGIIACRRLLMDSAKGLEDGLEPPGVQPQTHRIRSVSMTIPEGEPFQNKVKELMYFDINKLPVS